MLTVYYEQQPDLTRGLMAKYLSLIPENTFKQQTYPWVYLTHFNHQLDINEQLHVIRVLVNYCKRWHPANNSSIQHADSAYMIRLEVLFVKYSRLLSRLVKITYR